MEITMESFYDFLFMGVSATVAKGGELPAATFLVFNDGSMGAAMTEIFPSDVAHEVQMKLAAHPHFRAVGAVCEAFALAASRELTEYNVAHVRDFEDSERFVIINIMTAGRQALMACKIDNTTKEMTKPPFTWVNERGGPVAYGHFVR